MCLVVRLCELGDRCCPCPARSGRKACPLPQTHHVCASSSRLVSFAIHFMGDDGLLSWDLWSGTSCGCHSISPDTLTCSTVHPREHVQDKVWVPPGGLAAEGLGPRSLARVGQPHPPRAGRNEGRHQRAGCIQLLCQELQALTRRDPELPTGPAASTLALSTGLPV